MKTLISLSEATQMLATGFARHGSAECRTCTVSTPLWGPAPEGTMGIWYLKALQPCPYGCHTVLARLWADITSAHDIAYSPATHQGRPRPRRARKLHAPG